MKANNLGEHFGFFTPAEGEGVMAYKCPSHKANSIGEHGGRTFRPLKGCRKCVRLLEHRRTMFANVRCSPEMFAKCGSPVQRGCPRVRSSAAKNLAAAPFTRIMRASKGAFRGHLPHDQCHKHGAVNVHKHLCALA